MAIEKESLKAQEIAGLTLSLNPLPLEHPSTTERSDTHELEHPNPPLGPENSQRAAPSSQLIEKPVRPKAKKKSGKGKPPKTDDDVVQRVVQLTAEGGGIAWCTFQQNKNGRPVIICNICKTSFSKSVPALNEHYKGKIHKRMSQKVQ